MQQQNRLYDERLVKVPKEQWIESPLDASLPAARTQVWRNRHFLVQVFTENCFIRLTVSRCDIDSNGDWKDGISWEELQNIKNEIGYAEFDAVEVYPRQGDEVNVANMRHLWVMSVPLPFPWRRKP